MENNLTLIFQTHELDSNHHTLKAVFGVAEDGAKEPSATFSLIVFHPFIGNEVEFTLSNNKTDAEVIAYTANKPKEAEPVFSASETTTGSGFSSLPFRERMLYIAAILQYLKILDTLLKGEATKGLIKPGFTCSWQTPVRRLS